MNRLDVFVAIATQIPVAKVIGKYDYDVRFRLGLRGSGSAQRGKKVSAGHPNGCTKNESGRAEAAAFIKFGELLRALRGELLLATLR